MNNKMFIIRFTYIVIAIRLSIYSSLASAEKSVIINYERAGGNIRAEKILSRKHTYI